jgi:hypothetical protein
LDYRSHVFNNTRLFLSLEICFLQKWEATQLVIDEDEDDFFEPADINPANDRLAQAFRWVGLLCGIAMLGWTAVLLA